uniref:PLAT domain-containing protein n=1 Tax=Cuerna arida TaxID=1464854 RepID=A0A1B6GYP9_9HEMI
MTPSTILLWRYGQNSITNVNIVMWQKKSQFANVEIQVAGEKEMVPYDIEITCVTNCDVKVLPNTILFLKAKENNNYYEDLEFTWTYSKGNGVAQSLDSIKEENLPASLLIIKDNSLDGGIQYNIFLEVKLKGALTTIYNYEFETESIGTDATCDVTPSKGTKGETEFDIVCSYKMESNFMYEFYDKTSEEADEKTIFNGRMLGTSYQGELREVKLTRGNVVVYLINNQNGLSLSKRISVTLSDLELSDSDLEEIYDAIEEYIMAGNKLKALQTISYTADIIPPDMDKSVILHTLLEYVTQVSVVTFSDVKMCTSTLTNVLVSLNRPTQLALSPLMMMHTLEVIKTQANIFQGFVFDRVSSQWMSPHEIRQLASVILTCLHAGLMCKDPGTENVPPDDFTLKLLNELRRVSRFAEEIIELTKKAVSYVQNSGQPPSKVASKGDAIVMWAMEDDDSYPMNDILIQNTDIPVKISSSLFRSLQKHTTPRTNTELLVTHHTDNIYWWRTSDIRSDFVSISLKQNFQQKTYAVTELSTPLDFHVKLNKDVESVTVSSVTTQLDPNMTELDLELTLQIHRIDCVSRSLTSIKFNFPPTNSSLRVYALTDYRPDYEMVTSHYINITQNSPFYPYFYNEETERSFLFVGILPGMEIPINQSVPYSFEVSSVLCQYWDKGHWSSRGCDVNPSTKDKDVHCQCKHLSMFAAAFPVPPQEIDPFADAKLFLTVLDNPLVVALVASILLLYLLSIFFLWRLDIKDKKQRTVVVLEDNFPGSQYPYLLAVYTSSRVNSGTTAHVGFRLNGSSAKSRVHIFSARNRKVLKRNSDDWFLIYCDQYLGTLESMHIWHDNYGSSPEWFCDKIHVFDLKGNIEAIFVVKQWLALSLNDYPEAKIRVATEEDVTAVKLLFVDNFFLGIRESHVLLSVLLRHPRSEVNRIQRISVLLAFFMVAMLCSIMFYIPDDENMQMDDFHYEFGSRELFVSIQTLIIGGIIAFIIMFTFRRSYTIIYDIRNKPSLYVRNDTDYYYEVKARRPSVMSVQKSIDEASPQEQRNESVYQNFVRLVVKTMRTPPLPPIQLPPFYIVIKKRKIWFTLAWICCIAAIFVSAYLVMLYGLKLGPVKSKEWLSTVLASSGGDTFVSSPTKIICFAIFLAMAFQRMYEVNTHAVSYKEAMRVLLPSNEEHLAELLAKRQLPMYAPLTHAKRHELVQKKKLKHNLADLIDFLISAFFVIVICTIISRLWSSHYHASNHLHTVMTESHHVDLGAVDFYSISNIAQMEKYLVYTFMYAAYNTRWYNDLKFVKKNEEVNTTQDMKTGAYWLSDFTGMVLGLPLLRQLRVDPKPCGNQVDPKANCIPELSKFHEDTDVYGVGWKTALYSDVMRNNSPWKYTEKDSKFTFTLFRLYGQSGQLYERGGYAVTLGPTRQDADNTLVELRRNDWQDMLTRVVFLELAVYNINLDLLSQVTLIVEYMITGNILLKGQVMSVGHIVRFSVWKFVYIFYIIFYLYRCFALINREGLFEYLLSVTNVLRLFIVLFGFITLTVYFIFYYTLESYILSFEKQGMSSYFDFDTFMFYFVQLQICLSVLLCIAIIRLLMLLRFGRRIITYYYTITISFNLLRWLIPVLVLYVITLYFLAFYLNLYSMLDPCTLIQKYHRVVFKPIEYTYIHSILFVFLKIVSSGVFMTIFIIIFMYYIKIARVHKLKHSDDFNFIYFLLSLLKKLGKRKNN